MQEDGFVSEDKHAVRIIAEVDQLFGIDIVFLILLALGVVLARAGSVSSHRHHCTPLRIPYHWLTLRLWAKVLLSWSVTKGTVTNAQEG
jgi:hypothetical protein